MSVLWVWLKIVRLRLRSAGLQGVHGFSSKTKSTLSVVEVLSPSRKSLYYVILTLNRTFLAMKGNHHERIHLYTSL
jgi:hypothetical protein